MSSRLSRRAVLVTGLPAVTGCLGLVGPSGLRLGGVVLRNRRSEPVTAWLQVYRNGAGIHDLTYSLEPEGSDRDAVVLTDSWSDRVAVYEVSVRPGDGPADQFEYTSEQREGDCTVAMVEIREESIAFGGRADSAFCGSS